MQHYIQRNGACPRLGQGIGFATAAGATASLPGLRRLHVCQSLLRPEIPLTAGSARPELLQEELPQRVEQSQADPPCSPPALLLPSKVVPRKGPSVLTSSSTVVPPAALVLFSAYTLGATSTVAGLPTPVWLPALLGAAIGGVFALLNRLCDVNLWRAPAEPLTVVITGGSKGLGRALAREFLAAGDRVLITSRGGNSLRAAVEELQQDVGDSCEIFGATCDVSQPSSVEALLQEAVTKLGHVDMFICNAGYSGSFQSFTQATEQQVEQVVRTNLLGGLLCSRAAVRQMSTQPLGGHVFFVDGAGSDGLPTPQYAAYGATKCALPQLVRSLLSELRGTHVGCHVVSPGMMLTGLLLEGATAANKQVFNILCEHPETVAAFLVPRMRSAVAHGQTGTYHRYLTPAKALWRFVTAPARLGRFFDISGQPTFLEERERLQGKHAKVTARRAARARARTQGLGVAYSLSLALSVLLLVDARP